MVKYARNLLKLFSSVPDSKQCVLDGKLSVFPYKTNSKRPIFKKDEDGKSYTKQYDKQIPLNVFSNNNNISLTIGFDGGNYGKHLGVLDIDGYKKLPNDEDTRTDVWYDKELHKMVCDDLYQVLKDLPIESIHAKSWSNGYHLYYFTSQSLLTSDVQVLKFIKFPNDYHIQELQGKGINEISDMIEVFSKNNQRCLTYPSRVIETKKDSNGDDETRKGTYEILSHDPSFERLFDNPVEDISSLLVDTFVEHGFIFDEDGYKQAIAIESTHKKRVKTYKNKGTSRFNGNESLNLYKLTPKIKKDIISEIGGIINKTIGKHYKVIIALDGGFTNLGLTKEDRFELISNAIHEYDDTEQHIRQLQYSIDNPSSEKLGFNTIITLEPSTEVNIDKIKELYDKAKDKNRKEVLKPIEDSIDDLIHSMKNVLNSYENDSKVVNQMEKMIESLKDSIYPYDLYYQVYNKEKKVLRRQLAIDVVDEYNIKSCYDVNTGEDKLYYLTSDGYYDELNISVLKHLIYENHGVNYENQIIKNIIESIPRNSNKLPNLIQFNNGIFNNVDLTFTTFDEFDIRDNLVYKRIGVIDESSGKINLLTYNPNARLTDDPNERTYVEQVLRNILIPKNDEDNYDLLIDRLERDGETILGINRKNITISYDSKGNSGKSVINFIHKLVLNDLYKNVDSSSFDDNFNYELFSNNHSINIDETTQKELMEIMEKLKSFTSPNSSKDHRKQYGTGKVKSDNDGNIDIYTNHLIKPNLDDGGFLGRLTIITFPNQFRKEHEVKMNKYENAYVEDEKTYDKLKEDIDGLSWYVSSSINYYLDMIHVKGNFRCYQTKEQVLDIIGNTDIYSKFCIIFLERDDDMKTSNKEIKAVFEDYVEDTGKLVNDSERKISNKLGKTIKELFGTIKEDTRDGVVYPLRIKTKDEIEDDSRKILTSCDDDFTNIQMDLVKNLKESEKIIYNHIKLNELNTIEDLQRNYKTIDVNKIVYDLIQLDLIKYKEQHDLDDY